jgi:hypothetical protein
LRKYDTLLKRLRRRPLQLTDPGGQPLTVTYQLAVGMTLGALYDPSNSTALGQGLQQVWLATEQRDRPAAQRLRQRLLPPLARPAAKRGRPTTSRISGSKRVPPSSAPTATTRRTLGSGRGTPDERIMLPPTSARCGSTSRCSARRGRPGTRTATRALGTSPPRTRFCWSATAEATRRPHTRTPSRRHTSWRTHACSRSTPSGTPPSCRASASSTRSSAISSTSRSHPRAPSASPTADPSIPSRSRKHATASYFSRHSPQPPDPEYERRKFERAVANAATPARATISPASAKRRDEYPVRLGRAGGRLDVRGHDPSPRGDQSGVVADEGLPVLAVGGVRRADSVARDRPAVHGDRIAEAGALVADSREPGRRRARDVRGRPEPFALEGGRRTARWSCSPREPRLLFASDSVTRRGRRRAGQRAGQD